MKEPMKAVEISTHVNIKNTNSYHEIPNRTHKCVYLYTIVRMGSNIRSCLFLFVILRQCKH